MGSVSVSKMIVQKKTQEKNSKKKVTYGGVRTIIVLPMTQTLTHHAIRMFFLTHTLHPSYILPSFSIFFLLSYMNVVLSAIALSSLSSIVGTITTVTSNVYSLINFMKLNKYLHDTDITNLIDRSDIVQTIKLLKTFINEIIDNELPMSVSQSIRNVKDTILSIENEINKIKDKMKHNNKSYVMIHRKHDFKVELNRFEVLIHQLENRKNNLYRLIEIHNIKLLNVQLQPDDFDIIDDFEFDIIQIKEIHHK